MKKLLFLIPILLGFIIWPLTTKAGQHRTVLLTPTLPCSTVTPTLTGTPTFPPGSLVPGTATAVMKTPTSPQEAMVITTTTPTPTLPPCTPLPPCPNIPTVYPPTPTLTPTPTSSPCATLTPTATMVTLTPTPCFNTPTVMPPTATPWTTPTPTPSHVWLTPTAVPCINTPTPIPTPFPVFTATVGVIPHETVLAIGDILSVTVTLDVSEGCQYPILELTLSQITTGDPPFAPGEPIVLGPSIPIPTTITLTAVTTGTTTFRAHFFGEYNCGQGWVWAYATGQSVPVTVSNVSITPTPSPTSSPSPTPSPTATPSATPTKPQHLLYAPILKRD